MQGLLRTGTMLNPNPAIDVVKYDEMLLQGHFNKKNHSHPLGETLFLFDRLTTRVFPYFLLSIAGFGLKQGYGKVGYNILK